MRWLKIFLIATVILVVLTAEAFSGTKQRASRKSFFSVNPAFRADVLASEAERKTDDLLKLDEKSISILDNNLPVWETGGQDRWNEVRLLGLTLSLSRLVSAQEKDRKEPFAEKEPMSLETLLPLVLHGSFQQGDIEALGEFFRPQLNLGIEF